MVGIKFFVLFPSGNRVNYTNIDYAEVGLRGYAEEAKQPLSLYASAHPDEPIATYHPGNHKMVWHDSQWSRS